jgi:hypothetical protein
MNRSRPPVQPSIALMAQAELPPSIVFGKGGIDLWPYRRRTIALLRRYARASVEVGRLPSLLGREFFRSQVSSYTMRNFEDVIIFVTDMEHALDKLDSIEKKLLAMYILEEYTVPEVARLTGRNQRMAERSIQDALDQLSKILLAAGLLDLLPLSLQELESCQGVEKGDFGLSDSKGGRNKLRKFVGTPRSNLIS